MLEETENKSFQVEKKDAINFSDGRYKTLFEQVNAAAFLTTLDGKILEANLKSYDLLEYEYDELTNLSLRDIFPASTEWSQIIDEISAKGGINFETINIRKDGSNFPVDMSASLFALDGKPVILSLIWDITERKKAEKKLKESEEKYRGLFECTTDGIIVLDARGEILDVNCKVLDFFDFQEEDMLGNNFLSMGLLTNESISILVKQFEELMSGRAAKSHEAEVTNKDGKKINVEISSFFLLKKENEIDNFVVIIRDITDGKKAEIRLAREHGLLQTLMDNIPDSVYFKDEESKFIKVNKAKAAHYNKSPEEMMGKTDFDFLPEDQARKSFEDDQEILKTGKYIINQVEKITHFDGSERWVSVTKVPRFDPNGNIIGTAGISRDITKWKCLEARLNSEEQNNQAQY